MSTPRPTVARQRLVLLENDRHNIDELRDFFLEKGYECEVALDLETARTILDERRMDLAAVNLELADVTDEQIIEEFKERDPEMALVLYSGLKDKTRQRRLRRAGADSYLSKASDIGAVARAIDRVLSGG